MDSLFNHLDFWLAIFTLGALAYYLVWKDRVQPFIRALFPPRVEKPSQHRPRPIRGRLGRFAGSRTVISAQRSSQAVAASESGVADGNDVAGVTVSPEEAALIGLLLGRGLSPSAVIKSLPGYSPRKNYDEYKAKVEQVRATLASLEPPQSETDSQIKGIRQQEATNA